MSLPHFNRPPQPRSQLLQRRTNDSSAYLVPDDLTCSWPTAVMASSFVRQLVGKVSFYSFGLFNYFLFLGLFIKNGTFFKKDTEQDKLQYDIGIAKSHRDMNMRLLTVIYRTRSLLEPGQRTPIWLQTLLLFPSQRLQAALYQQSSRTRVV